MKKLLLAIIAILPFISNAQSDYRKVDQKQDFRKDVIFRSQIKATGIGGSGAYLALDSNDNIIKTAASTGIEILMSDVTGLINALNAKQDTLIAGDYISIVGDTIFVDSLPVSFIIGLSDSLVLKQNVLTAGTNITISGDTISASGGSSKWTDTLGGIKRDNFFVNANIFPAFPADVTSFGNMLLVPFSNDTALHIYSSGTFLTNQKGLVISGANVNFVPFQIGSVLIDSIRDSYSLGSSPNRTLITYEALSPIVNSKLENITSVNTLGAEITTGNVSQSNAVLKKLRQGSGISIAENPEHLTFSVNQATLGDTAVNLGTGSEIFKEKSADSLLFRVLQQGSNITLTQTDTSIIIASSGGGGGIDSVVNVGTGEGLFKEQVGDTLKFKTIVFESGRFDVSTTNPNEILVDVKNGGITTLKLSNNSVTTPKITDGNVTNVKLADMTANTVKLRQSGNGSPLDFGVSTNSLLGRGGGNVGNITLGDNLSIDGSVLNAVDLGYAYTLNEQNRLPDSEGWIVVGISQNSTSTPQQPFQEADCYFIEAKVNLQVRNDSLNDAGVTQVDFGLFTNSTIIGLNSEILASIIPSSFSTQTLYPYYKNSEGSPDISDVREFTSQTISTKVCEGLDIFQDDYLYAAVRVRGTTSDKFVRTGMTTTETNSVIRITQVIDNNTNKESLAE